MPYNFVPGSFHTGVTVEALRVKIDRKSACDGRTDGQTDGQTEFSSQYRVCITCSAVKTLKVGI